MEEYYTFQVILHRKDEGTDICETHEYRDCTVVQIKRYRETIWTQGLRLKQSDTCWEIVSPFMIKSVFIIKQDKKFGL